MTRRSRILAYGAAGLLIVAGIVCVAAVSGVAGGVLGTVLIGLGGIASVGLVFYEVGLSEDRELERERRERRERERAERAGEPRAEQPRRRLGRRRGERRRLR